ncbi:Glutamyl/glutaminyl-tRNA synthetase,Glutamyl/glutaminyl-tRNA synthetase, class Ib [Cinara cedri]|uniref:Glutamyl/glutaminyl-tRNA synthetase,Glutamyl/glutaminyl-tRNA synthetase, class Ib n=1 Tax=Cinara cedri TaxID=506608 RepID=A0A5E4N8I7_9HEMI|nr:Glutamyl/glutaminyl-tRNA synthetase,Glutamyl/glutaminyl-tRNA synthetase, class Ib [Cinara cedri]
MIRQPCTFKLLVEEQGTFVKIPEAVIGKVVVRFTLEAGGYLHIGHAKTALLNAYYQESFMGKFIMRFDDSNPEKAIGYEKIILEDINMLTIKPNKVTYTSNYFRKIIVMCESLIKSGHAFVDYADKENIRLEREQKIESINRNNSIKKNVELWDQMKLGSEIGQMYCVRAKIDMSSVNFCMRDPIIYRCNSKLHFRTADNYKVYPTYNFSCAVVDSLERITHCLRTTDYADHNEPYYWFYDKLKLGKWYNETRPYILSYSRLNMTNTVLSKEKLTWFVEQGLVDGWNDPRMPTVRGLFRRGLKRKAFHKFVVLQGSSQKVRPLLQWDTIWSINQMIIDNKTSKHTALLRANSTNKNLIFSNNPVEVLLNNVEKPYRLTNALQHPKNVNLLFLWGSPKIIIDYRDAELLEVGGRVTLINWGTILIDLIEMNPDSDKIEKVHAKFDFENIDLKPTFKITWLPIISTVDSDQILPSLIPVVCVYFDHLINKPNLTKDDDFKQFITETSRREFQMWGSYELKFIGKGRIIQLQRKGYFICDSSYQPYSTLTGKEVPLVLFHIPDESETSGIPITSADMTFTSNATEVDEVDEIKMDFENVINDTQFQLSDMSISRSSSIESFIMVHSCDCQD